MRDDLGRTVMVSVDPDHFSLVREFADLGKNSPVVLLQPSEIDRVEHVAVENELLRRSWPATNRFEKVDEVARLAVVAAEVDVGDNNGVEHASSGAERVLSEVDIAERVSESV